VTWPGNEGTEDVEFFWREPLDFIGDLVTDALLAQYSHYHAVLKYLCRNGKEIQMIDEPWTGDTWYEVEVIKSHHA
jgi:hypothetical protein